MSRSRKHPHDEDTPARHKRYIRSKARKLLRDFERQYRTNNMDPNIYL